MGCTWPHVGYQRVISKSPEWIRMMARQEILVEWELLTLCRLYHLISVGKPEKQASSCYSTSWIHDVFHPVHTKLQLERWSSVQEMEYITSPCKPPLKKEFSRQLSLLLHYSASAEIEMQGEGNLYWCGGIDSRDLEPLRSGKSTNRIIGLSTSFCIGKFY